MARRSGVARMIGRPGFWFVLLSIAWILGSLILLLEYWTNPEIRSQIDWYLVLYMLLIVIASPITFVAYLLDKRRAKQGVWRIAENSLHLLDLVGGWPGGLIAQKTFRHKTQKTSFQLVYWFTVAFHVLGVAYVYIKTH